MHFFEKIKGYLGEPSKTFNVSKEEPFNKTIKYYVIIAAIYSIFFSLLAPEKDAGVDALSSLAFYFVGLLALEIIAIFINGAIIHIGVYFVGGRKGITQTIKAVMYGSTPGLLFGWILFYVIPLLLGEALILNDFDFGLFLGWTFILPSYFFLFSLVYPPLGLFAGIIERLSYATSITDNSLIFISTVLSIVPVLWSVVLWVIGIRQLHELTTRRAIVAVLMPMIPFMIPLVKLSLSL